MNKLFPKFTFTRKEGNHIDMKVLIKAYTRSTNTCWLILEEIQVYGSKISQVYIKNK